MTAPVNTNGFNLPPGVPATQPQGTPPQQSAQPVNGNPIQSPGQTPGWVQHVATGTQPQPPAAQPPGAPPATAPGAPDMSAVMAALQAALGGQQPPAPSGGPQGPQVNPSLQAPAVQTLDTPPSQIALDSIEDPVIRSMASVLQAAGTGLNIDRVLGQALKYADPSLIDTAYLAEKGGPAATQLAEIAKGIVTAVAAKAAQVTENVHRLVGGEQQWQQSVAVFNTQAPSELRMVVSNMLNSTRTAQIEAAAKIVAEFGKAAGIVSQPAVMLGRNTPAGGLVGQGLSKEQFQAELLKLDANPDVRGYETAREALFARRSLGKRAGL